MVKTHAFTPKSLAILAVVALFTLALAVVPLMSVQALGQASLTLSDPRPGEEGVEYQLEFGSNNFSGDQIQGIEVTISDDPVVGSGSVPAGDFSSTSATLGGSTDVITGSWNVTNGTNGTIQLDNASGEVPTGGLFVLSGINNGDTTGITYYLSFTTYDDTGFNNQVDQVVVAFVYTDGELVTLNIPPTLTFIVDSVASGVAVNGVNTNVESTASGIDFTDDVTTSQNGISAHRLEVTTNASFGFVVYLRSTGPFSSGSHDINDTSGTNETPASFSSDESWGYTSDDDNLESGSGAPDRFDSNLWAQFTTTNEPVFDEITGFQPGTESTFVGHQVGIDATTPAGSYQTTLIYTAVPTY